MACPNCDHTMQQVSGPIISDGWRVFWCPRCGTLKSGVVKTNWNHRIDYITRTTILTDEVWIQFNGFRQLAKWLIGTDRGTRFLDWFGKHYFKRIMATSAGAELHEQVRKEVLQEFDGKRPLVIVETNPDGFIRVYSKNATVRFVNRIETFQSCEALDEERCSLNMPLALQDVYLNDRCLVGCDNVRLHPQTLPELLESQSRGELFHAMGSVKRSKG